MSSSTAAADLPVHSPIQVSFIVTYILLMTTAAITFIEALRTPTPFVRHVLNLETAISLIAGYFYSVFVGMIQQKDVNNALDWKDVTNMRYIDWSMTTPLMLITLCLVTGSATNAPIHLPVIVTILALNYAMLYAGYLGEQGALPRTTATVLGFAPFAAMFGLIYNVFLSHKYVLSNTIFFSVYVTIWALYGFVYLLDEVNKNIAMNMLDCVAKCLVGIGLFLFYTRVIRL